MAGRLFKGSDKQRLEEHDEEGLESRPLPELSRPAGQRSAGAAVSSSSHHLETRGLLDDSEEFTSVDLGMDSKRKTSSRDEACQNVNRGSAPTAVSSCCSECLCIPPDPKIFAPAGADPAAPVPFVPPPPRAATQRPQRPVESPVSVATRAPTNPSPPPVASPEPPSELLDWLQKNHLGSFASVMAQCGYDMCAIQAVAELGEDALKQVMEDLKMSALPDQLKFRAAVRKLKSSASSEPALIQLPDLEEVFQPAVGSPKCQPVSKPVDAQYPRDFSESAPADTFGPPVSSQVPPEVPAFKVEFRRVQNAIKVHQEGRLDLDYWTYEVALATDLPSFSQDGSLSTHIAYRRYGDFKWLRAALLQEFPGAIVPPLPGLGFESKLDKAVGKAEHLLGIQNPCADDVPMLVTYRMMGLTLFLQWLEMAEWLPRSRTLLPFMTNSAVELVSFQEIWAQERKKDHGLKARAMSFGLRLMSSKGVLPPALRSAQNYASEMDRECQCLRGFFERLWDRLDGSAGAESSGEVGPVPDSTLSALNLAAREVDLAGGRLSPSNRLQLMRGIANTRYLCGLCESIKEALSEVENLVKVRDQSAGTADAALLKQAVETAETTFGRDFSTFHRCKGALLKEVLHTGAQLPCTVDIVTHNWRMLATAVESLAQ
eukprot:RCo037018